MGAKAVDVLLEGKTKRVIGYKNGEYVDFDINEALAMKKTIPDYQLRSAILCHTITARTYKFFPAAYGTGVKVCI